VFTRKVQCKLQLLLPWAGVCPFLSPLVPVAVLCRLEWLIALAFKLEYGCDRLSFNVVTPEVDPDDNVHFH
jgi:hypothetical protein